MPTIIGPACVDIFWLLGNLLARVEYDASSGHVHDLVKFQANILEHRKMNDL
jgi:hypothetical protein